MTRLVRFSLSPLLRISNETNERRNNTNSCYCEERKWRRAGGRKCHPARWTYRFLNLTYSCIKLSGPYVVTRRIFSHLGPWTIGAYLLSRAYRGGLVFLFLFLYLCFSLSLRHAVIERGEGRTVSQERVCGKCRIPPAFDPIVLVGVDDGSGNGGDASGIRDVEQEAVRTTRGILSQSADCPVLHAAARERFEAQFTVPKFVTRSRGRVHATPPARRTDPPLGRGIDFCILTRLSTL